MDCLKKWLGAVIVTFPFLCEISKGGFGAHWFSPGLVRADSVGFLVGGLVCKGEVDGGWGDVGSVCVQTEEI